MIAVYNLFLYFLYFNYCNVMGENPIAVEFAEVFNHIYTPE